VCSDQQQVELCHNQLEAENLGEYTRKTAILLCDKGCKAMVTALCLDSDLSLQVQHPPHPAAHLLDHLWCHGAPVIMKKNSALKCYLSKSLCTKKTHTGTMYQGMRAENGDLGLTLS